MPNYEVQYDEDAEVIYQGTCKIKSYGRANNGTQFFTVSDLDMEQFTNVMENVPANTPVQFHGGVGSDVYMDMWHLSLQKAADGIRTGPHFRFVFPELDQDAYDAVKDLKESEIELFITVIKGEISVKKKQPKGKYGQFARKLMSSALMYQEEFWVCVGTEYEYFEWLTHQECCITGRQEKVLDTGEYRVAAAHIKPLDDRSGVYFAVPMHPEIHAYNKHAHGIVKVWQKAGRPLPKKIPFPIPHEEYIARYYLSQQAYRYLHEWVKEKIKKDCGVKSLSYLSPDRFEQYMRERGAFDLMRFV